MAASSSTRAALPQPRRQQDETTHVGACGVRSTYVHGPYVGGGRPPAHAPNSGAKRHLGPARGPLCGVDGSAAARTTRWQKVNIYCGYSTPVQVKC
jgi:hypothetical protein